MYHIKKNQIFDARIYIGSKRKNGGGSFDERDLGAAIKAYQHEKGVDASSPVRITPTVYVWDEYQEDGWQIGIFNYPRCPLGPEKLYAFAVDLAGYLLDKFDQNRISIEFPAETVMLEADDAEDQHE